MCQLNHHSGAEENAESRSKYYTNYFKLDNCQSNSEKRDTVNKRDVYQKLPS